MRQLVEVIKIADIHAAKIKMALDKLHDIWPITASNVANMPEDHLVWIELLVHRFAKLQDLIGSKLVDAFFESRGENTESLTVIDKINRLEKLLLIENADIWLEMRKIRNNLTHEYPDNPEITAKNLNEVFLLVPQLLSVLDKIKLASR